MTDNVPTVPKPAPAPAPVSVPAPEGRATPNPTNDIVTLVISFTILVLATWMIVQTFAAAAGKDVEAFNRKKDIMLYGLALLGTVTGYYLGRVPAERRADSAEKNAETANKTANTTQDKLADAHKDAADASSKAANAIVEKDRIKTTAREAISETLSLVDNSTVTSRNLGAEGATISPEMGKARQKMQSLLDSLN